MASEFDKYRYLRERLHWVIQIGESKSQSRFLAELPTGNSGNTVKFYVAANDGVVFNTDYQFNKNGTNTLQYYLSGKGSVNYKAGVTTGNHQIKRVQLPANLKTGETPTKIKTLFSRKLVSFGNTEVSNVTFAFDGAVVVSPDFETPLTAYNGEGALTADAAFGTYQLTQKDDGVYISYVGYAKPFTITIR